MGGRTRIAVVLVGSALAALTSSSAAAASTYTVSGTLDSTGGCVGTVCPSLRSAISAANAAAGPDRIDLQPGIFRIELGAATPEDGNASGDLDVGGELTIQGAGAGATTILGALPAEQGERDIDVRNNANLTLLDITVSGGRDGENTGASVGGGIRSEGSGTLELERVAVSNNSASGKGSFGDGGGIAKVGGLLVIKQSAILGNTALHAGAGAGLYASGATTTDLTNVVIAGNHADSIGGGMELEGPSTLAFDTIVGNSATNTEGGGILGGSESFHLRGSIVTGNTSPKGADCSGAAVVISDGGNVAGASCGLTQPSDFTTNDAMLGPLEGSPLPYLEPGSASPALDRVAAPCPAIDIRGVARPQGAACDAGAVERVVAAGTGTPISGGTIPPPAAKAPTLTAASQSHSTWRTGSKLATLSSRRPPVGTVFAFALDAPARVVLTFTQSVPGRRVGGRCVAPVRSNRGKRSCKRTLTRGSLPVSAHAGKNSVSFQGRLSATRKLSPGSYAVLISASNAAGRSQTRTLSFTIVP